LYTLYEVAFKGTQDRLYLTESREDAIRRRNELRAEYAAAGSRETIVARRVHTIDYYVCGRNVFDDVADLHEVYHESETPTIHYTDACQAAWQYAHGREARLAEKSGLSYASGDGRGASSLPGDASAGESDRDRIWLETVKQLVSRIEKDASSPDLFVRAAAARMAAEAAAAESLEDLTIQLEDSGQGGIGHEQK